ncbi:anti-sigma factor family protein [Pseudoduganella sp. OTU4001]|uniref:anti-sigma factor family protein n=1 Tax=Pseudoduganella sp. OTU4001 TaxID=3043854 RepID=UPI00313D99A6
MNEAELQAWVDGRLPPDRQAAVDRYLEAHPEEEARLLAYRAQNEALHALFDDVLTSPVPPKLAPPRSTLPSDGAVLRAPAWSIPGWRRMTAMVAVAVGASLVGGAAGWSLRGARTEAALAADAGSMPRGPALPRQAAIAHAVYSPEVKHPVEVGADQQQHLVAWLSKRLGKQLRPPTLTQQGYELVGGRLLPGDSGPVAQFMYAEASGQRMTLYVSPGQKQNRDTGFRFAQEGNVGVFYWIDGSFGYALSAAVGKGELSQIANAVYEQLQP